MENPLELDHDVQGEPDELCRRIIVSDRSAFEEVFRRFRDEMLRYVRGIIRSESVAHDLVQDVFVDLWGTRHTLDPSRSLKAFLYGMARNRALRYLRDTRAHGRKHTLLQREADTHISNGSERDHDVDAALLGDMLHQWIDELPDRQQEALMLSRYHDLSHHEIALVMDISPRTVNNHIIRALKHLNERIQTFEPAILK
jgi:RNA polymerase sigma-70 factor (ECF subfamily)